MNQNVSLTGRALHTRMIDQDENELLRQVVDGDTQVFQLFIKRYEKLVSHIVFRLVSNFTDRQDICQDIFVKIYVNLPHFRFQSKLSTWIARIAYHTCLNYLKRKKVALFDDQFPGVMTLDSLSADASPPDRSAEANDISFRLFSEIKKIPVQYRTILTLYHLDEMSYAEIAEIMSLPEGTVKSYLFRARKYLKEKMLSKYQKPELCT